MLSRAGRSQRIARCVDTLLLWQHVAESRRLMSLEPTWMYTINLRPGWVIAKLCLRERKEGRGTDRHMHIYAYI